FGAYKEELIFQESIDELPEDIFIGMELDGYIDESPEEGVIYVVTNIEDDFATLNANHPLAGRTLTFEGTITEIQELSKKEIEEILHHGHHHHD
ncbi:MAG: peptidylprolyl isomerase, partial [Sulfurimonas sp.]|nr:peptidylprolyl isomerase [Sulfurimonas sp.]